MAMKQNNFYLRWQKAAGAAKSEQRSRSIRTAAPGIAVVAAAGLGCHDAVHRLPDQPAAGHRKLVQ